MPTHRRLLVAHHVCVLLGLLIAARSFGMEQIETRIELTGAGNADLSGIRGESISVYGVYVGQPQDDAAKALAQHKMTFTPMSRQLMTDQRVDPKYQLWFINEPTGDMFPGLMVRLEAGVVNAITVSTVPSEFRDREKENFYRRFTSGIRSLLTTYSHEAQIKAIGTPKTSTVETPLSGIFIRRDFYPDRGISVTASWTKNVSEAYADVGISLCHSDPSVADACK